MPFQSPLFDYDLDEGDVVFFVTNQTHMDLVTRYKVFEQVLESEGDYSDGTEDYLKHLMDNILEELGISLNHRQIFFINMYNIIN